MFILTVAKGPDQGKQFALEPGRTYTVGSAQGDEIRLSDPTVLGGHCSLEVKTGLVLLRNLTASAGTFVGEKKIAQAELRGMSAFRLGESTLSLRPAAPAKPTPPPDPLVGKIIGGYKLNEVVGKGGMGTVYRATQLSLHRDVAVKVLAPALAKDKNFVDLFINEARAAAQLVHPNIVQVYDAGSEGEVSFFSMEFIGQGSVEEVLEREKQIPWERAILMVLEAAHGLEFAEGKGIVHRDIKPDNLMLNEDGRIKIADLGLAKRGEGGRDQEEGVIGTPHFIPPEQALGKKVDTRADIYSLGATFFRMITGRTLFTGQTAKEIVLKHIKEPPPAASSVEDSIPDDLDLLLARMLAKSPDQRFGTARELITALEEICAHHGIKGAIIRKGVGKRVLVPLLLLLLAGGGAIIHLATRPDVVRESDEARDKRLAAEAEAKRLEELGKQQATENRKKTLQIEWGTLENEQLRINNQNPLDSVYDDEKTAARLESEWSGYCDRLGVFSAKDEVLEFEDELGYAAKATERADSLRKRLANNKLAATAKREWNQQQKAAAKDLDTKARLALSDLVRERHYEEAANYCDRLTREPRPKDDPFAPVEGAVWQNPVDPDHRVAASTVKEISDIIARARQYFVDEGKLLVSKAQGDWEAVMGPLPASPDAASDADVEKAIEALRDVETRFVSDQGKPVKEIREIVADAHRRAEDLGRTLEGRQAERLRADRDAVRRVLRDLRSLDPGKTPNLVMNLETAKAVGVYQQMLTNNEVKTPRYRAFLDERIRMLRWIDYLFGIFQRDVRITDSVKENAPLRSLETEAVFEEGGRPFSFRFDKPTDNPFEFRLNKKYQGDDVRRFSTMPMDWIHSAAFHIPGKDGAAGEIRWVEVPPVLRFALGAFCYETMQFRAASQHFEALLDDESYGPSAKYLLGRCKLEAAARGEYEQLLQAGEAAQTAQQVQDVLDSLKTFGRRHAGTLFYVEVMRPKDVLATDFFAGDGTPTIPQSPPVN